jgi:hypothetical protein
VELDEVDEVEVVEEDGESAVEDDEDGGALEVEEVVVVELGAVLDGGLAVLVAYGPTGSLNCIMNRP